MCISFLLVKYGYMDNVAAIVFSCSSLSRCWQHLYENTIVVYQYHLQFLAKVPCILHKMNWKALLVTDNIVVTPVIP